MTESTLPPEDEPDATTPPGDEPDATTDTDIDDIRAEETDEAGDEADPYQLRSMPAEPHGTDDDPGSYLNP